MTSQLRRFRARSILEGFVVTKLILLVTKAGWSALPYSINLGAINTLEQAGQTFQRGFGEG